MIVIERRFCGPPGSGHGGYTAGLLASMIGEPTEVTLRRPPPLERPLDVEVTGDAAVLRDGDVLVAEAKRIPGVDVEVPDPIRFADAEAAAAAGLGALESLAFRTCFACGTDRTPPDGLGLVFGPVPGREAGQGGGIHAAPWTPDPSFADGDGNVRPELVWAAVDCPGVSPLVATGSAFVLGRIAVERVGAVPVGYRYIVLSWLEHRDGRKGTVGVALTTDMGDLRVKARATWIEVDAGTFETQTPATATN